MKKFIYVVFVLSIFVVVGSSASEASYCDYESNVFFGNGMFNEQSSAESSLRVLKRRMISEGDLVEEDWVFELSYNHNEQAFSIPEVFRQRMGDQVSSYWRWLSNLEISPDWFQSATQEVAATFAVAESLIDADLRRHVQRYKNLLMEGNRVLVVAHSQGNFYANAAYENLASDNRMPMGAFGILSVGTPASYVAGGGSYYTLVNDIVIGAVRAVFPSTLPGNVGNTVSNSDWTHHNFIDAYLSGNQSGPMIINRALGEADSLAWPTPQVGTGPISVTLTWGAEPDVDLHIYEPDWSHVYYANMRGSSGYLDYDDIYSWGPEHYYVVDCESLATGIYSVGVNYYHGQAPETAHVQVQAGDIIRDYSINLPYAEGSSGNSNPEPVASIEVLGDLESGYEFNVEGR